MLAGYTKSQRKEDAHLIVFGDYNSGKRSLITELEKLTGEVNTIDTQNDSSVLHYMRDKKIAGQIDFRYYSVKNPDDENMELAKVKIWIVDPEADKDF